jgi:ribosomal RNA-processing protein 12
VSSLVYLVSLALHDTTPALVNARCEDVLSAVTGAVRHTGGAAGVGRHAAAAIAGTLALVDAAAWTRPAVQRAYLRLVALAADADPKTRRRGRDALQSLIDGPRGTLISTRTSAACATHVVSTLRDLHAQVGESIDAAHIDGHSAPTRLIHLITSIGVLTPAFRPADASAVAKELIVLASQNLPHVTVFAYNTLATLFDMHELVKMRTRAAAAADDDGGGEAATGSAPTRKTVIPTAQLGKMVTAVAELTVPADAQEEATVAFAVCLSRGAVTYFEAHAFSPPPAETMALAVKALVDCLDPVVARLAISPKLSRALQDVVSQKWLHAKPDVFAALEPLFGYRFKAVWLDALAALRRYLEHDGCAGNVAMQGCVATFTKRVVKVREQAFGSKDRQAQGVSNSILAAVLRGGGVQSVLEAVPLDLAGKQLLTNAWILPLLHEHVRLSPMTLFTSKLRPLAEELTALAARAGEGGRLVEAKNATMLAAQLWDLLPSFCQAPSDLAQDAAVVDVFDAFTVCLAPGSGFAMRQSAFGGLRSLSLSVSGLPPDDPGTAALVRRFAKGLKKLFPALCQVVEETAADRRGAALEAITKAAYACGDAKLVTGLLRRSVRKLLEASVGAGRRGSDAGDDEDGAGGATLDAMSDGTASAVRHAATDVAIAIAESGAVPNDCAEIDFLERAMSPLFLDPSDTGLQKKAYRATALLVSLGVIGKDRDASKSFVEETAAAAGSVATSAKGTRLGLVQALVELARTDEPLLETCTSSFLSEVVLGTRDVSEKTRAASFSALSALARAWYATGCGGERANGLRQFLMRLAAGLAGRTVTMLSATLTSLSHVIYEYRGEAGVYPDLALAVDALFATSAEPQQAEGGPGGEADEDGNGVMSTGDAEAAVGAGPVAILLRHNSREVQKAALGTVKMATSALSTPTPARLIRILPAVLPGLVTVAAKSKKKETRLRVRVILERLLRKCGRDSVEEVFPPEHAKLLAAVRKQYSRDLTKKHEKRESRRAETAAAAAAEGKAAAQVAADDGDDDASDGEGGSDFALSDSDSDVERDVLDGDELARRSGKSPRRASRSGALLVREDGDNVVDLLETRVADGFMTRGAVAEASKRALGEQRKLERRRSGDKDAFKVAEDGRPIFAESDAESGEAEQGSVDDRDVGSSKKRKRRAGDGGERAKKVKGSFGGEYRSRRGAAGDMKRPGMPDPYAYIPLGGGVGGEVSKALVRQGGGGGKRSAAARTRGGGRTKAGGRQGIPARR